MRNVPLSRLAGASVEILQLISFAKLLTGPKNPFYRKALAIAECLAVPLVLSTAFADERVLVH